MSTYSFHVSDGSELDDFLSEHPDRSAWLREAAREKMGAEGFGLEEEIAEKEGELEAILADAECLREELDALREQKETAEERLEYAHESKEESVVAVFGDVVTVKPDMRTQWLRKSAAKDSGIPGDDLVAVLEAVDLHYFDEFDGKVLGDNYDLAVQDAQDADCIDEDTDYIGEYGDDLVEFFEGLTPREEDDVRDAVRELMV